MTTTSMRLLALLSMLQARRVWPGQLLAGRLEVSPRTVRRDVQRLREMGYRIQAVKGPDGGYRLDAGSELPPLLFDDDQAVALAVALQLAAASGAGVEEAATRALATVRQVMPSRLRHRIDTIQVTAIPTATARAAAPVDPAVLLTISIAVRACDVLRFDYSADRTAGPDGLAVPSRRVQPHHVVTWSGRWYLVAWDLDRDDWRIFRIDEVAPRLPTGPRFARRRLPGGDVSAFVSARFKGSAGADAWPCMGEVILALPASAVSRFSHHGVVEDLGPERCRFVEGSWSWPALAAAIGRFDADVEVVGPPELTRAFADLARRFAAAAASGKM